MWIVFIRFFYQHYLWFFEQFSFKNILSSFNFLSLHFSKKSKMQNFHLSFDVHDNIKFLGPLFLNCCISFLIFDYNHRTPNIKKGKNAKNSKNKKTVSWCWVRIIESNHYRIGFRFNIFENWQNEVVIHNKMLKFNPIRINQAYFYCYVVLIFKINLLQS